MCFSFHWYQTSMISSMQIWITSSLDMEQKSLLIQWTGKQSPARRFLDETDKQLMSIADVHWYKIGRNMSFYWWIQCTSSLQQPHWCLTWVLPNLEQGYDNVHFIYIYMYLVTSRLLKQKNSTHHCFSFHLYQTSTTWITSSLDMEQKSLYIQ